jgi:predicted RNase H-like nuclease (RuvC/YqgF family)
MPAPRTDTPTPNTLRQRRWAERQREKLAAAEQRIAALDRQLAECMRQRKQLAAELARLRNHWIAKWIK